MSSNRLDNEAAIRRLSDREDIRELIGRWALALDTRDWAMLRSLVAERFLFDFTEAVGGEAAEVEADGWVANWAGFFGRLTATQHMPVVYTIEIRVDSATAVSNLHAQHHLAEGDRVQRMIGRYEYAFERRQDGWRITGVKLRLGWNEGDWSVIEAAAGRRPQPA